MKGNKWLVLGIMALTFGLTHPASAWVLVGPLGDTGWQTFSIELSAGTYTAGFVVSNQGDDTMSSWLLLDNLSHGYISNSDDNRGFELGNYFGYTLIKPIYDNNNNLANFGVDNTYLEYTAKEGTYMSWQESRGTSTTNFINAFGQQGSNGSILETEISLQAGGIFSFNWAFITSDDPTVFPGIGNDFALFYLVGEDSQGIKINYTAGLAQVVPVPATLLLFGSGLLGLAGIGLRRKKRV